MKWLAISKILSARLPRRPALVYLLVFLLVCGAPLRAAIYTTAGTRAASIPAAIPASMPAASAASTAAAIPASAGASSLAADGTAEQFVCLPENGCRLPPAPPPLLNLDQALFAPTPAQSLSLRELEKQAIADVITLHGLTAADTAAVATWGRYDALASLYALLVKAIGAPSRTTDEQNAVDWLSAIAQRISVGSAESAAREYVKWAGLDQNAFESLLNSNPSQAQLTEFLNDTPVTFNDPNTALATGGWCTYAPPDPYSSEYTARDHPLCISSHNVCSNPLGCRPAAPTYDQFVKWGTSVSNSNLLTTLDYSVAAREIGIAMGVGLAVAAAAVATALGPALAIGASEAIVLTLISPGFMFGYTWVSSTVFFEAGSAASVLFPASVSSTAQVVGGGLGIGFVIAALVIAVFEGIAVVGAAELPGKLAELIDKARTTSPGANTLLTSNDDAVTLISLLIFASLPEPLYETCDNSVAPEPPGVWWLQGWVISAGPPCLNPSSIPESSPIDPQFLITAHGASSGTMSPTITYTDAESGLATTARLSKTWFIVEANGSVAQSLRIHYLDWGGKAQVGSVLGNETDGYMFFSYAAPADTSTPVDATTCVADGICSYDDTLEYMGDDGNSYSAKALGPAVTVGESARSPLTAAEGSPQSFKANGFSFVGAEGELTYQWRFQDGGCINGTGGCMNIDGSIGYGAPVAGSEITHTWPLAATLMVELTAIDSRGVSAATAFPVNVENVPPTLTVFPDCDPIRVLDDCISRTQNPGGSQELGGRFADVGGSYLNLAINWGDGQSESLCIGPPSLPPCFNSSVPTLQLSWDPDLNQFAFAATHDYAAFGTYYGTVSVSDPLGGATNKTFLITVPKFTQVVFLPTIDTHTYGDAPLRISATGGASGQPVSFAVTGSQRVCALFGVFDGTANVILLNAGTCSITIWQAGNDEYGPAPPITASFTVQPAPLTITASSPTMFSGDPLPAITPIYDGFVGSDSADSLDLQLSCSSPAAEAILWASATHILLPGAYGTHCSDAAPHPNYTFHHVTGVLHVVEAATTLALMSPW